MPTYTILGATGQVGGSVLQVLMQSEKNTVHAYCRSKSKLLNQCPQYATDSRLQIFEGNLNDTQLLAKCCRGVKAVFMCVAATTNQPHCRIAQDQAEQVIATMEVLKVEKGAGKLPTLVVLSSASTEEKLCRNMPGPAHFILYRALWWIYEDLSAAEKLLRSHSSYLNLIFFKPGAISHDVQSGHVLSTEEQASPVSFLDVAAGMVECADGGEEWVGKAVSVLPKASKVKFPLEAPFALVMGLLLTYFPWLWRWLG